MVPWSVDNPFAGALDHARRQAELEELQRVLLGSNVWDFQEWPYITTQPRLARGVGAGQTTLQHARAVGSIFGDEVFNQSLGAWKTFTNMFFETKHHKVSHASWEAWSEWSASSCVCSSSFAWPAGLRCAVDANPFVYWIWWPRWTCGRIEGVALYFTSFVSSRLSCCGNKSYGNSTFWLESAWTTSKVQSLIDAGFLKLLVDFGVVQQYWNNMLKDFPSHPAGAATTRSIPLTLYGHFTKFISCQPTNL